MPGIVRGDPVVVKTGAVIETATDFVTDDGQFALTRRYRSKATAGGTFVQTFITNLGGRWSYDFAPELQLARLQGTPEAPFANLSFLTPDGSAYDFKLLSSGVWQPRTSSGAPDIDTRLKVEFVGDLPSDLTTIRGATSQWRVTDSNDTVWTMQTFPRPMLGAYAIGRPISRVRRDGYRWDYLYNPDGTLISITDSYGRVATFEWVRVPITTLPVAPTNAQPVPVALKQITLPDQTQLRFTYDPPPASTTALYQSRNLIKVERLDANGVVVDSTSYLYEDPRYPAFMTGVINHRGERTASWTFTSVYGQAASAEGPGGADRHTYSYDWSANSMIATVTGPLGKADVYTFTKATGYDFRLTSINGQATVHTPATTTTLVSNTAAATLTSMTDALMRQTTFLYDSLRRPTSMTEAAGTAAARTTSVAYDPTLNLPTTVTRPGLTESRSYSDGKLAALTLIDTTAFTVPYATNGRTRTWDYSWSATGQLLAVDGPLPGAADSVTMTYDTGGQLLTQTNPLGHVTQVLSRNLRGQPLIVRDPNGVDTVLTYDAIGRPLTVTRDPGPNQSQYSMTYDAAGNLTRVTLPLGGWLNYTWDAANRLKRIANDSGEFMTFTLNAAGQSTADQTYAPGGILMRQVTRTYDELGRQIRSVGAGNQTWALGYDSVGNLLTETDARGKPTSATYDAFDRQLTATNAESQTQSFAYTPFDADLTQFTDARGLATGMTVDGFGQTIQEVSPDRGTSRYWYDEAGRLTQVLDADGVTTAFAYDAAGRMLSEVSSGSGFATQTVTYSYDSTTGGNRGIGRLTGVSDPSGTEALVYDAQGRVVQRTKVIAGRAYTFGYVWDANGQLVSLTYPSGRIVKFNRLPDGRVFRIRAVAYSGGPSVTLADAITWKPFGPLASYLQGNGLTLDRSYDGNYWLTGVSLSGSAGTLLGLTLTRDPNGRVIEAADSAAVQRAASYSYTDAGRLATAVGAWGNDAYTWDANSNRIRADRTVGGATASDVAVLSPGTNRLAELRDGANLLSRSFTARAGGDIVETVRAGAPTLGYSYDARGRLAAVTSGGATIASYAYDWREQRVAASSLEAGGVHYLYAEDGQLLGEYDAASGAVLREYVWLDTMPLAMVTGAAGTPTPSYSWITTGNLNEPLLLTNAAGTVTASTTRDPWGNPILLAGGTPLDLGYPGQWQDPSTGLFQNWHRDYDPTTGRYLEADPLGLGGGSNLFGYAGGDPVNAVDPDGRNPAVFIGGGIILFCAKKPKLCANAIRAAGAVIVPSVPKPRTIPTPVPRRGTNSDCEPDDDCDAEWREAIRDCEEQLRKPNPDRGITGGYRDVGSCARGLVSERCKGNKVSWPPTRVRPVRDRRRD